MKRVATLKGNDTIMAKRAIQRMGLAAICVMVAFTGCSKSEKPAKPQPVSSGARPEAQKPEVAKPEVTKTRSNVVAAVRPSSNVVTLTKAEWIQRGGTNEPSEADMASMRAAQVRSTEAALKMIDGALAVCQKNMDDVAAQMADMEVGLTASNASVSAARGRVNEKRKVYDAERAKLPGMDELFKTRETAKARLREMSPEGGAPDTVAAATVLREEIRRLGKTMIDLELKGREESVALKNAVDALGAAESDYHASLMGVPGYGDLARKHHELLDEYSSLLNRRSDFTKENRKHE